MKFQVWKADDGWRWRLRSSNGRIVASGEGYKRQRDCLRAVSLIQESNDATVVIFDNEGSETNEVPEFKLR